MDVRTNEYYYYRRQDADFFAGRFVIDPRYPNVMYVNNYRANTGNKFFRTIDSGATWQNISDYMTQGSVNGLAVSPVTGEVYNYCERKRFECEI